MTFVFSDVFSRRLAEFPSWFSESETCHITIRCLSTCDAVYKLLLSQILNDLSNDNLSNERRGSVVVITSAWHAAGRWFDSRTRHVSLLGVKTWLSTGIVYL